VTTSWATAARDVPGLDHDPCPGDVPAVHRLAGDLRSRADGVGAAAAACRAWGPTGWRGEAAEEAQQAVADLADGLAPLRRSFEDAAVVLERWAVELDAMQARPPRSARRRRSCTVASCRRRSRRVCPPRPRT
jgi:hypothetical protein